MSAGSRELLPGASSSEVSVEGVRFALHRSGPPRPRRTTPVLLLHGVPETSASWRSLLPELARDRVVLAPDLKGLGESEVAGPYDSTTLSRELAALVLHEVDGPVDVVGHDWGGSLGLTLAASRPDLVRRLVVMSAPYRHIDLRRAWHIPLFDLPVLPELVLAGPGRRWVRGTYARAWRSATRLPEDVLASYESTYADSARLRAMLGYYRAATRSHLPALVRGTMNPSSPRLPELAVRAERQLVVWGAADPILPLGVGESVVRDLGANTAMLVLPGVGHWPHEEAPAVVTPAVAAFLREGDPVPRPRRKAVRTSQATG